MDPTQHASTSKVVSVMNAEQTIPYEDLQREVVLALQEKFRSGSNSAATIVEPVADYGRDPRRFLGVFAFPPPEIVIKIKAVQDQLLDADPRQFAIPPHALHLTLKNIRTIADPPNYSTEDLLKVKSLLSDVIPQHTIFPARGEGFLLSPSSIAIPIYTSEVLRDLALSLDERLKEIGVPDDKQYASSSIIFSNITIIRFTQPPSVRFYRQLEEIGDISLPPFEVKEARLISSNLAFSREFFEDFGSFSLRDPQPT